MPRISAKTPSTENLFLNGSLTDTLDIVATSIRGNVVTVHWRRSFTNYPQCNHQGVVFVETSPGGRRPEALAVAELCAMRHLINNGEFAKSKSVRPEIRCGSVGVVEVLERAGKAPTYVAPFCLQSIPNRMVVAPHVGDMAWVKELPGPNRLRIDSYQFDENVRRELATNLSLGQVVHGVVTGQTTAGLTVQLDRGVRAFVPASQVGDQPIANLDDYLGREIETRIIGISVKTRTVILSRKAVLDAQNRGEPSKALLAKVEEGLVVTGRITKVVKYGLFVDIGGIEGLLRRNEIAEGWDSKPGEDGYKVGAEIQLMVLQVRQERNEVALTTKNLATDPWVRFMREYPTGTSVAGTVTKVASYGAFVKVYPGIEGLLHVSEMAWVARKLDPADVATVPSRPGNSKECVLGSERSRDSSAIGTSCAGSKCRASLSRHLLRRTAAGNHI